MIKLPAEMDLSRIGRAIRTFAALAWEHNTPHPALEPFVRWR